MKKSTSSFGLLVILLAAIGCAAEMSDNDKASGQTIENAQISMSGEKILVEGSVNGEPTAVLSDLVLVETASGEFTPWQEQTLEKEVKCYSCFRDGNGPLHCARVMCAGDL